MFKVDLSFHLLLDSGRWQGQAQYTSPKALGALNSNSGLALVLLMPQQRQLLCTVISTGKKTQQNNRTHKQPTKNHHMASTGKIQIERSTDRSWSLNGRAVMHCPHGYTHNLEARVSLHMRLGSLKKTHQSHKQTNKPTTPFTESQTRLVDMSLNYWQIDTSVSVGTDLSVKSQTPQCDVTAQNYKAMGIMQGVFHSWALKTPESIYLPFKSQNNKIRKLFLHHSCNHRVGIAV